MAKASLARIDRCFAEAIESEKQNPRFSKHSLKAISNCLEAAPKTSFGFNAHDASFEGKLRENALLSRRGMVEGYQRDIAIIEREVGKVGLTLKARGTRDGLTRLFDESNLYSLHVTEYGTVPIWTDSINEIADATSTKIAFWLRVIPTILFGVGGGMAALYWLGADWTILAAVLFAATVGYAFGGLLELIGVKSLLSRFAVPRNVRAAVSKMSHDKLVGMLFKGHRSSTRGRYRHGTEMPVKFPDPPADVAQKIALLRNVEVVTKVIVASADAITFPIDVANRLAQIGHDHALRNTIFGSNRGCGDPIICVELGHAMGIIDQFGDIAIEEEAVQNAVSADYLF